MYDLFIKICSWMPLWLFEGLESILSFMFYGRYIRRIKSELLDDPRREYAEYASGLTAKAFFFHQYPVYNAKYYKDKIEVVHEKRDKWVIYNGRKMFLKSTWTRTMCAHYIKGILSEQDRISPHRYLTDKIKEWEEYGTVIDIGAAEGNFTLDIIDKSSRVYLFEPDEHFADALKKTFMSEPKAVIVDKFVADRTKAKTVSLDEFFGDRMPTDVGIIKMDIEGGEQAAIKGMQNVLRMNPMAILLICVYHTQKAEEEIKELLNDYEVELREGLFLVCSMDPGVYPYLRHGVMEARKKL